MKKVTSLRISLAPVFLGSLIPGVVSTWAQVLRNITLRVALLAVVCIVTSLTLYAQPTITSFSPTSGVVGTTVTITGTGFNTTPANNVVFFGATRATVSAATATSLTVTVPAGATYGPITELNTGTTLAAYSMAYFNPIFSPAKTDITTSDFAAKVDYTTGSGSTPYPFAVVVGDLDGDGKPDLVVANQNSTSISVFRNTGSSFAAKVDFTTTGNTTNVAIGDIDGDGKLDLVVPNNSITSVSVFRNTSSSGSISFAAKVDIIIGANPISAVIGDVDGDGKLDLAVARGAGFVSVLRNTGSSGTISFAAQVDLTTTDAFPYYMAIGDLDGDGKLDLAVPNSAASSTTVSVFRNTSSSGTISFAAQVDFTVGAQPVSVAIGDLDGDGKLDLAVPIISSTALSVLRNTGSSGTISFAAKVDFTTGAAGANVVAIGDLDGNGKPDLAVTSGSVVSVFRNTGSSGTISFATKVDFAHGSSSWGVAIGDLDGNGVSDLAVSNLGSNTVSVFRNLPSCITVNGSTGADGNYVTMGAAFTAINNNATQTGNNIVITVNGSPTETATAALNAGNWTSLKIYPTVTGLSVTGSGVNGPLIQLNGADNVTIDGRVNANTSLTSPDLIITNPSATTASTIQFINGACSNTVQYCNVKGAAPASYGIVMFSTSSVTYGATTGNYIQYNNITNSGTRPVNAIYSLGTASYGNNTNYIQNNNIYDFLNASTGSYGINLAANTSGWTISGNSFYETASFAPTNSAGYNVIYISNTSGTGFTVSNNYIGGQAASCGGLAWTKTNANANDFNAIHLSVGTGTPTSVQGNTIQNFSWSNSVSKKWYGIYMLNGDLNVGTTTGNIIGSGSGTGSISYMAGSSLDRVYGMLIFSGGRVTISNNIIGSITSANGTTTFVCGIYNSGGGTITISNNTIGSTSTANSINASSASTGGAQTVSGIYSDGTGTIGISGNTIANLTNGTTNTTVGTAGSINGIYTSAGTNTLSGNIIHDLTIANANTTTTNVCSVGGIVFSGTSAVNTATGNTIYNLSNTYATFAGQVAGIYFTGSTGANVCSGNFIHNLTVSSSSGASVYGIKKASGAVTLANNIVMLGTGTTNANILYGIYETGAASNNSSVYFNTVYLSGSPTLGAYASYALYNAVTTNTKNFRNNLLVNARSNNGATGAHYAVWSAGTTGLTCNYNDYYVTGTGGAVGFLTSARADLAAWQLATSQDGYSLNVSPSFANAGGTAATDYVPSYNRLCGILGTGITTDYSTATRTYNTMGAYDVYTVFPVEVWKGGTFQTGYFTLRDAFAAINAGTHTGDLVIKINDNTTETVTAVLNYSGSGSASYTSINIYPTVTGLSVSGSLAAPLIDLNGADNVTIDGRVNGTGSTADLTITNTRVAMTAPSAIRFIADASNNTVKYCTIKGSQTSFSGIIFFSTGTAIGNNNNTIESNNITCAADANRPFYAIYSMGTASYNNLNNSILNNNIYNFWNGNVDPSYGIMLANNNSGWTISGNSFYETTSFEPPTSAGLNVINIYDTGTGSGFTVSNNYIGGQAPLCGGSALTKTNANSNVFISIRINVKGATVNNVEGNKIKNINWSNVTGKSFTALYMESGNYNITGNTIGSGSGTDSISCTAASLGAYVYGVYISSTGTVTCSNNTIGSITGGNIATLPFYIYGIYKASTAGTTTISNNTIGSTTTANSINASSASTANPQVVCGIYNLGTETNTISGNTIANLTNGTTNGTPGTAGLINGIYSSDGTNTVVSGNTIRDLTIFNANTATDYTCSVGGIVFSGTGTVNTATGNTIYNLKNKYTTFAGQVAGIYFTGSTSANVCNRNFIYGLSVDGVSSTTASIYGIKAVSGATTYSNNIISLGGATKTTLYGLYDTGAASQNCTLYFNTIYLGGTLASGSTNKSYCLYSAATNNNRNYRNNLLVNERSTTGGSSLHYAAYYNYSVTTNLTYNDYNDYYVGTGGTLGYFGGDKTDLPIVTGMDANSKKVNPLFVSAGGTAAADYVPQVSGINGTNGTGIITDYFGVSRSNYTMGAIEQLLATVTTEAVSGIGATTATGNGTITSLGTPNPTAHGVCWSSTNASPTTSDSKVDNGAATATGAFTAAMTGLTPGTLYYVRAYATNGGGTVYGAVVTFDNFNYWYGTTNTDWNTTSNWSLNILPASGEDIYFAASPSNHCVMDQNRTIGSLHNAQSTYRTVTNGHNLTINGAFNQSNGAQVDASATGSTVTFAGSSAQSIPAGTFYNNQVVNVAVNNANNVTLYGSLNLSGSITSTAGALDATSQSPSVTLNGGTAQTLESNTWLNNSIYNLTIANTAGVNDNALFTVSNNLTINTDRVLTINAAKTLNVNGTLTNNAGNSGLILASTATGTGSLVHNTNSVPATVNRYIDGAASAWHFLSSPVSGQAIHGTGWTPSGTYGDGTGYDLYVWDEPASCWIYNLNTTVDPTWSTVHPTAGFVPGRGYLYAVQAATPTKQFAGNLNNGTVNYALNYLATGSYKGFNLIGNPYPSSIDWKTDGGYSRSQLEQSGGGYNVWIWSTTADNYGVYNSAFAGDAGTNNVTRYIPPMEGFFVQAASAGTFSFYNSCRVHNEASNWLKAKSVDVNDNLMKIRVSSDAVKGQDEVMLYFGCPDNENGAMKIFNTTYESGINKSKAPNLFLPYDKKNYSIRYIGDTKENSIIPLNIKVLNNAGYVLHFSVPDTMQNAVLEDKLTGQFNRIVNGGNYSFKASTTDQVSRFNIRFGSVEGNEILPILIYRSGDDLIIDALAMKGDFQIRMLDLTGRNYFTKYEHGGTKNIIHVKIRQVYLITVTTQEQRSEYKIIF